MGSQLTQRQLGVDTWKIADRPATWIHMLSRPRSTRPRSLSKSLLLDFAQISIVQGGISVHFGPLEVGLVTGIVSTCFVCCACGDPVEHGRCKSRLTFLSSLVPTRET